ncbi:phage tail tape measure protein [Lactococcus raffinolactis]|uniref:phage tail tape measure protein n=1 Tax=Pseudolactococcus raffinolactis TaxID=1366 RepID=UPI0028A02826|nr:phage tail tape measure protein [Lactococcus raffinolactis]
MANKNIKGITIELDGNTTGLQKALKTVDSTSVKLNGELKEVNKLLKFDPSNTELVAQKQKLLTDSIENTSTKLDQLKSAQSQVDAQFKSGSIGEEQYRAFNREVAQAEQSLNSYKSQLSGLQAEQQKLGQNTDRLNTYFSASGKSIDDFADILGTRLVSAIKNGTATSDQLEIALNKIGKEALGADVDINKFKSTLDSVKSGNSLDSVKSELQEISPKAKSAEDSLDDMADAINGGNMMEAGEIISSVGDKIVELGNHAKDTALEFQTSFGTIAANTNLSKAEMESLKGVAVDVFKSGVTDSIDEATNATIIMKNAFKDLNNEDLGKITEQVVALSKRTNTEYTDNIKAADYLMKAFGVSNKEAFDMIAAGYKNGLNSSNDFTDTIIEYSGTVKEAGYSQEEFFSMLDSGLKNGVRNTDLIADSMVEFGKKLAAGDYEEMIGGMSAETQNMFNEYKNGNATVSDVMSSVQQEMKKMSPAEQQKLLTVLGSQFEDIGTKGFLGLSTVNNEFKNVNGTMDEATKKDPAQKWQSSWNELSASLSEVGTDILNSLQPLMDFLADMAKAFTDLPEPVKLFIEVVMGLIAVFALLTPVIAALAIAQTALDIALAPFLLIVLAVIAVIALLVVIIANWGAIVDWLKGVWDGFVKWLGGLWDGMKEMAGNVWNSMKETISNVCQSIADFVKGIWQGIKDTTSNVFNGIKDFMSSIWDGIKNMVSNAVNGVKNTISNVWDGIKNITSNVWNGIKSMITTPIEAAKNIVSGIIDKIKGLFNFRLKFPDVSIPHIPLPHFSLSGSFNPLKGQIPRIGIDWFASGGILTKPTVFGMNGGNFMAGGEAGKEAVAPLSDLMAYVQRAVKQEIGGMDANFAQMIQLLTIIASKDMNINMDGKTVMEIIDGHMNTQQQQAEFGMGRM